MIPKTVGEAKKNIIELYKKAKELVPPPSSSGHIVKEDKSPEHDEYKFARNKIDNYNLALYSLPWFKPKMIAWMVDVKFGDENPFSPDTCGDCCGVSEEEGKKKIELLMESPGQFTEQQAGSLGKAVQDYITNELKLTITDRGGSCCGSGGHIGCPCTDGEMELMVNSINVHFKKAIDAGMMAVKIAWFKPRFFLNDNAMDAWIEGHNDQ
jgi:hypothetical protein